MRATQFDFFGELRLEVRGEGGRSTSQFRTMFSHFRTDDTVADPDMVIERVTSAPEAEVVLGGPTDHYGWTGDRFVVRDGSEFMLVEPGWRHISVSPDWEPFHATYPVEFALRSRMIERDKALVHASGVELDGQTTLLPAWRGAGKTNSMLSLLRAGGNYLSDDRLWVGADGDATGYPLAVNLQPHNIDSFPTVEPTYGSREERLRAELSHYVDEQFDDHSSLPEKAIRFLNAKFLRDESRSFTDIDSLYPNAEFVPEASVDSVVVLRAAPNADRVTVEAVGTEMAMENISAIHDYEWNSRLREYFTTYDALVPDASAVERLDYVVRQETRIMESLLRETSVYLADIPRKSDWGDTGVDEDVVATIRALDDKPKRRRHI